MAIILQDMKERLHFTGSQEQLRCFMRETGFTWKKMRQQSKTFDGARRRGSVPHSVSEGPVQGQTGWSSNCLYERNVREQWPHSEQMLADGYHRYARAI